MLLAFLNALSGAGFMNEPLVYDPSNEAIRTNPFPFYEALQESDPVHWSPAIKSWIITRYDDVRQVAMSSNMSSDRLRPFYEALKDERHDILSGVMRYLNEWLVFKAPPPAPPSPPLSWWRCSQ